MTPQPFLQKIITISVLWFVAITTLPSQSFADNTASHLAPYIQYYSPVLQGIVVERADGTDSRVLGRGLVPFWHDTVAGSGWSPSGEWFAWTSWQSIFESATPTNAYVVKTDGSRRLTILDDLHGIYSMEWFPNDWLLVKNYISDRYPEPDTTWFYLIDVPNEKVIQSFTLPSAARVYRSPDRQYLFGAGDGDSYNGHEEGREVKILSTKGDLIDYGRFPVGSMIQWHSDGRLLSANPVTKEITLFNVATGEKAFYPFAGSLLDSIWSLPSGKGLLAVFYRRDQRTVGERSSGGQLWYLNLENGVWRFLANSNIALYAAEEYSYKPAYGSLLLFRDYSPKMEFGQLVLFDVEKLAFTEIADKAQRAIWSPSGRYVLYTQKSDDLWFSRLMLYDVERHQPSIINSRGIFSIESYYWDHFSSDEQYLIYPNQNTFEVYDINHQRLHHLDLVLDRYSGQFARWVAGSSEVYIFHGYYDVDAFRYDLLTGVLTRLDHIATETFISPDAKTMIYKGTCPLVSGGQPREHQFCLEDRQSGWKQAIPPHSAMLGGSGAKADWHPDSEWLFIETSWDGWTSSTAQQAIVRRDGAHARDLNSGCSAYYASICRDWVPERIDVDKLLPPPQDLGTNPITLVHPGTVTALAWSPDGTRIASSFSTFEQTYEAVLGGGENAIVVWDTLTHKIVQTIPTPYQQVSGLAWTSDGQFIAASVTPSLQGEDILVDNPYWIDAKSQLQLWRVDSGELVQIIEANSETAQFALSEFDYLHLRFPWPMPTPDVAFRHYFDNGVFDKYGDDSYGATTIWMISFGEQKVIKFFEFESALTPTPSRRGVILIDFEEGIVIKRDPIGEAKTLAQLEDPRMWIGREANQLAVSQDEQLLALSGLQTDQITIWDLTTGQVVGKYYSSTRALDFSPNGLYLAAAASYTVRIWEVFPQPFYIPQKWERVIGS